MVTDKLRRLGYGWLVVQGLLAAATPKTSIKLNARLWGLAFENTDELEPKPWYVRSVRAAGVGLLAAGGVGLLLEDRAAESDADAVDDDEEPTDPITIDTGDA
ncbi:hypothetical protein BV210_05485 [Halorientalis sp. IM1011]|uniref:hypothetical protein n=1 Tax=Halorientalis sp. IM1011 TaxID=1932360 RepID=UPI00097CD008|nr:hypothetical protein [Halorientalis sp. IM1011]AQL42197.1 hypothetical protein BV210_05485 [Halorientalis sp. IM1011]